MLQQNLWPGVETWIYYRSSKPLWRFFAL